MDSVDDAQTQRRPTAYAAALDSRDGPAVERRVRGRELTTRAQVAIQRAQHHIETSVQRIDRCQVRLLASTGRLPRTTGDDSDGE